MNTEAPHAGQHQGDRRDGEARLRSCLFFFSSPKVVGVNAASPQRVRRRPRLDALRRPPTRRALPGCGMTPRSPPGAPPRPHVILGRLADVDRRDVAFRDLWSNLTLGSVREPVHEVRDSGAVPVFHSGRLDRSRFSSHPIHAPAVVPSTSRPASSKLRHGLGGPRAAWGAQERVHRAARREQPSSRAAAMSAPVLAVTRTRTPTALHRAGVPTERVLVRVAPRRALPSWLRALVFSRSPSVLVRRRGWRRCWMRRDVEVRRFVRWMTRM
jgi:hypothetical protein